MGQLIGQYVDSTGVVHERTVRVDEDGSLMVVDDQLTALGDEQISNATLATSAALASIPAGARIVLLQATGQNVRYRTLGASNAPTASRGQRIIQGGDGVWLNVADLSALRFIREADGATLDVTYFK